MKAIIAGDLVAGLLSGDVPEDDAMVDISPALASVAPGRLRYDGTTVYEPSGVSKFYVDNAGVKHVQKIDPAWPSVTCDFDAPLKRLENGGWIVKSEAVLLSELKARLSAQIDVSAEQARSAYITTGSGQAMIYQRKADEAHALVAAGGTPDAAAYPILSASVGIEADTLAAVASMVIARENAWLVAGAAIEGIRLSAKKAVGDAADAAAAIEAAQSLTWPRP